MRVTSPWMKLAVGAASAALLLTACRGDSGGGDGDGDTRGITDEACTHSDVVTNEGNGCIYLGIISDLTSPAFSALANPLTDAQKAFWNHVNEEGGIGGYDIDAFTYVEDSEYNVANHVASYERINDNIFALAQTLGSPHTLAILNDMRSDNIIAGPASWNSAWDFESLIVNSGSNYCFDAMNGVEFAAGATQQQGGELTSILSIGYEGDYGGDFGAGAEIAADVLGLDHSHIETPVGADAQGEAIAAIVREDPGAIFIATGPLEMATIAGGAFQQGWQGLIIGAGPTWNPALLGTDAGPLLEQAYFQTGPWPPYGYDSAGHQAMRDALGLGAGDGINDGYTAGWIWSYPLKTALEVAADEGKLNREGLVEVAERIADGEITVDYEGALPEGFEPNQSTISGVDTDAPTGVAVVQEFFTGQVATAHFADYTEPCFALN